MFVTVVDLTNISNQLVAFGYSNIIKNKSVTGVPFWNAGIMKMVSSSSVSIEE